MPQTGSGVATREAVHSAAARLSWNQGFSRTTVRRIAAAAGTDPVLVIRRSRSEELLFPETMTFSRAVSSPSACVTHRIQDSSVSGTFAGKPMRCECAGRGRPPSRSR
ncbi:TetR/AcrR family transcriptional regulator [Streptomyces pimonensis]|uniref:TetR/AcrR family transcriptional regulator n=1 Tax=Streptomyces pimonensis TaxID=2860288 RepID=A0ABV4J8Z9_9ACTN